MIYRHLHRHKEDRLVSWEWNTGAAGPARWLSSQSQARETGNPASRQERNTLAKRVQERDDGAQQAEPSPHKRWSGWKHEPETPSEQPGDCKIAWKYSDSELLQRLRDLKDNLKYISKDGKLTVDPNKVREEFEWLQYRHLREVFSHPLEESFQIKKVPNYKWEYPHCEPLWVPRFDQRSKWAPFETRPAKASK